MSDAQKSLPFFPEFAANELADNRKSDWSGVQWGWYYLLKLRAWHNDPKGKLPNKAKLLQKYAKAELKDKRDKAQWKEVLACFRVDGEFLIHPELYEFAREKGGEKKKRKLAGQISAAERELKFLSQDDPRRADLQKRLADLRSKTEAGIEAAAASGTTTKKTTAPRSKKSPVSRGKADSNIPDQPELVPAGVEKSTSTKYADIEKALGPLQVKNGKTNWNGQWWYPGELQKQLKLLQDKLAKKRTDLDRTKKGSSDYAQCLNTLLELKRAIAECEFCLGVLPKDTPAPEPLPVKAPAGLSPSEEASNIEAISDPAKLRDLEREFIGRVEEWKNPSQDMRSIAYTATGKLSAFGRKRLEAAETALEKVRNRMADLGVSAAN